MLLELTSYFQMYLHCVSDLLLQGEKKKDSSCLRAFQEERMWFQRLSMLFRVPFASLLQVYSWTFNYLADVINQI